jgi:hypothetical protein
MTTEPPQYEQLRRLVKLRKFLCDERSAPNEI